MLSDPSTGPQGRISLLMISNFGVADGGRETWAHNFIPRLLRRWPNTKLELIGLHRAGQQDNRARLAGLLGGQGAVTFLESKRKRFPILSMLHQAPRQLVTSKHPEPDLVIGVGSVMELVVILASPSLRRARRIVWLRTILLQERPKQLGRFGRLARAFERRLLRSADLLIANGEDTAKYYRACGLDVEVIPNGVDVDRWRSRPPKLAGPLCVVLIGRLIRHKGLAEYLTLAKRMHGSGFEFHLVGEGPYEREAQDGHREGWLVHHGVKPNDEIPALIATMDVCACLALEGSGGGVSNALLEQMASGRVILAWDNVIYRQLLDERNAWLVPQSDVDEAEKALRDIAKRPDEARRRAAAAEKSARRFSFDAHVERFASLAGPLLDPSARSEADRAPPCPE